MPIYTQHGLKIRFDQDKLEPIVNQLKKLGCFDDILHDVELWTDLPIAIANIAGIVVAFMTMSWSDTILWWLLGYVTGTIVVEITYSDFLKMLFSVFLGSRISLILAMLALGIYLGIHSIYWPTIVLAVLIIFGNISPIGLILSPFRIFIRKILEPGVVRPLTYVEKVFVHLCNIRAKKFGVVLDWDNYTK